MELLFTKKPNNDQSFWKPVEAETLCLFNAPESTKLVCITNNLTTQTDDLIGKLVQWSIQTPDQSTLLTTGMINSITASNMIDQGKYRYLTLHCYSPIHFLSYNVSSRTWVNQSIPTIISAILARYHIQADFSTCSNHYPLLDYTVQFQQTDLDFLQQLCHQHGLFFTNKTDTEHASICFGDHVQAYALSKQTLHWPEQAHNAQTTPQTCRNQTSKYRTCANTFVSNDYQPTDATANLKQTISSAYSHLDQRAQLLFPNQTTTPEQAQAATTRLATQQTQAYNTTAFTTTTTTLALGQIALIAKEPNNDTTQTSPSKLLPISITHSTRDYGHLPFTIEHSRQTQATAHYANTIHTIALGSNPYYPPLIKQTKPSVPGLLTATVVANTKANNDKSAIATDHYARVKIHFPWDQNNPDKDPDLCPWVRVMHSQNGISFTPHIGDEVCISHENECLDRPVIVGSAYNSTTPLPLNLAQNPTLCGIKTAHNSSAQAHFLYADNRINKELIMMKSMRNLDKTIGNSQDKQDCQYLQMVAGQLTRMVKGDYSCHVTDGEMNITASKQISFSAIGDVYIDNQDPCKAHFSPASSCSTITLTPLAITITGSDILLGTPDGTTGELATVGCMHTCPKTNPDNSPHQGGPIIAGSPNVSFSGKAAARLGDPAKCHGPTDTINQGNNAITVNDQPVAVVGVSSAHGGVVTEGVSQLSAVIYQAHSKLESKPIVSPLYWIQAQYIGAFDSMPYTIKHSNGTTYKGKLDGSHTTQLHTKLPAGNATITFGDKAKLEQELKQDRQKLKQALDKIISQVKAQAKKDRARLAKQPWWDEVYIYGSETAKSFGEGAKHAAKGAWYVTKDAGHMMVTLFEVAGEAIILKDQVENDLLTGNIADLKQLKNEAEYKSMDIIHGLMDAKQKLTLLMGDGQTWSILENFAKQYEHNVDTLMVLKDIGQFAGGILPAILLALIIKDPAILGLSVSSKAAASVDEAATLLDDIATTLDKIPLCKTEKALELSEKHTFFSKEAYNEANRKTAEEFYREAGYPPKKIDAEIAGIDLDKPVTVDTLPKGKILEQKQRAITHGGKQGNYYSELDAKATNVGINPEYRDRLTGKTHLKTAKRYVTQKPTKILKSTAGRITDTWSIRGEPFQAEGGATQYFTTNKDNFMEILDDD